MRDYNTKQKQLVKAFEENRDRDFTVAEVAECLRQGGLQFIYRITASLSAQGRLKVPSARKAIKPPCTDTSIPTPARGICT